MDDGPLDIHPKANVKAQKDFKNSAKGFANLPPRRSISVIAIWFQSAELRIPLHRCLSVHIKLIERKGE